MTYCSSQAKQSFEQITENLTIRTQNINTIAFQNSGGVTALINGLWPVYPGTGFSSGQIMPNCIDTTTYFVRFDPNSPYNIKSTDPDLASLHGVQNLVVMTTTLSDL